MIKLFTIDMDGTLLNSNGSVDESTKQALQKLNNAGVKTVLCSGRMVKSIEHFNDILGIDNPLIGNNGSIIKINKDEIIYANPLEDEDLQELISFCHQHKFKYHFYDEDTFYSNRLNSKGIKHLMKDTDYGLNLQCNLSISNNPFEMLKARNRSAYKILIGNLTEHPYDLNEITRMFVEKFGHKLYVTSSGIGNLEIMKKGVSKWNGAIHLADFLGINKDEIAAIGDSHNDLPMIEAAKLSFAMGNANETVKSTANYAVSDNDNGGIAEASQIILDYNKENPSV